MKNKVIIGIDVGSKFALSASIDGEVVYTDHFKFKTLQELHTVLTEAVNKWKPDLIVTAKPTRRYNTIVAHTKYITMIDYVAEKHNIKVAKIIDSSCKNLVLGHGKASKDQITQWAMERTNMVLTEDQADSIMFIEYVLMGGLKKTK